MEQIVTKDRDGLDEEAPALSACECKPTRVVGPIYGVPADEVLAWVKSWATNKRLPRPKARRIR